MRHQNVSPKREGAVDIGTMMRVSGTVKFRDDADLIRRLLEERPFLRSSLEITAIIHVQNGEAWFLTWENNLRKAEIKWIPF